ncbi:MAG TPA: hypothetical protein VG944_09790 [Fimbriimonas sp.]|nr:hypothetical protein [Fimbriimonas sp.]
MDQASQPLAGRKAPASIGGILFFVLLPLLTCHLGGCLPMAHAAPTTGLDATVQAYRQAGLPWEAKDLPSVPHVPLDQNADFLIQECMNALDHDVDGLEKQAEDLAQDGKFDQAAKLLSPFYAQAKLAKEAVRMGKIRFEHDWDEGPRVSFEELETYRRLAKLLSYRALSEASHGQTDAAIDDLRTARKLQDWCSQGADLMPYLIQMAVTVILDRAEQRCAAIWAKDSAALNKLENLEEEPRVKPDLTKALHGSAFWLVTSCRNFDVLGGLPLIKGLKNDEPDPRPNYSPKQLKRSGLPDDPTARAYLDRVLRFWIDADAIIKSEQDDPRKIAPKMDQLVAKYSKSHSASDAVLSVELPAYTGLFPAVMRWTADAAVTKALVKAMAIHAETGKFPPSISQIPGDWIDPCGEKPLHLKLQSGGIRIYSVGPNGKDDGGVTQHEREKVSKGSKAFDIVAAYPMPK